MVSIIFYFHPDLGNIPILTKKPPLVFVYHDLSVLRWELILETACSGPLLRFQVSLDEMFRRLSFLYRVSMCFLLVQKVNLTKNTFYMYSRPSFKRMLLGQSTRHLRNRFISHQKTRLLRGKRSLCAFRIPNCSGIRTLQNDLKIQVKYRKLTRMSKYPR